ncbi:MAG: membrane protein insertase YidC [Clostridia bacterium]|nr:membrane protein insertase YidC [Clostridia bacterium]
MQWLFNIINIPLSYVLNFLADIFGNSFAAAVFVFTILINLVMLPLSIKSQKSAVDQLRIKPKLDLLKEKYGDDKQKYSIEMQNLYREENISMSGGCLPMLFRLVFMMSIYYLISSPLTYLLNVPSADVTALSESLKLTGGYKELDIIGKIMANPSLSPEIASKLGSIDFSLFGLNLTKIPNFSIDVVKNWDPIWLIPFASFASQMLTSFISVRIQKRNNPDAPSMTGMLLFMPIISLIIGFTVPAGVAFYWACSSIISGGIQSAIQSFYGPHKMLANQRAKSIVELSNKENKYLKERVVTEEK